MNTDPLNSLGFVGDDSINSQKCVNTTSNSHHAVSLQNHVHYYVAITASYSATGICSRPAMRPLEKTVIDVGG